MFNDREPITLSSGRKVYEIDAEEAAELLVYSPPVRHKPLGGTPFQDYIYRRLRKSAASNGVDFEMEVHDFSEDLPPFCAILPHESLDIHNPRSYIMKRINDRLPYRKDNLIFISRRAFNALNSGLALHEWKILVQFLVDNQPGL